MGSNDAFLNLVHTMNLHDGIAADTSALKTRPRARCRYCGTDPKPGADTCHNCGAPALPAPTEMAPGRPVW